MGGYWFAARNLVAEANWRLAPVPLRLMVLACARRESVHHNGFRLCIGWLWGVPYLISVEAIT